MVEGEWNECGNGQTGSPHALARAQFVGRGRRSLRRMPRNAQRLRRTGGDDRRPIADNEEAVERAIGGGRENGGDRRVLVIKADRDGAVLPGVVNQVAAIGRKEEFDAKASRSLAEGSRLITGGGRQDEDTRHG